MNDTLEKIILKLNTCKKAAVFCHVRPDGDAIGSGLALTLALKKAGKFAVMCCEDVPPEKFCFLEAITEVKTELPDETFDTYFCVDSADITRIGVFAKYFKNFKGCTVNIDHHISNTKYADYNYVRVCPASCEIIADILVKTGWNIDSEIADLLMLGLITDSGNFTHNDVSAATFRTAATLREKGADVNKISYQMFARQTKARALLYGQVINKIRFELEDKVAFIIINQADLEKFGADTGVTEGFVDFALTIDGVEVSISVLEFKKGQYKVSLRSKGTVNVNSVASDFGGGGHILASGCMIFGELEEVIDRITYAVYKNL